MNVLRYKKPRLILALIASLLFCFAAIFFLINELVQNQVYFTRSFGKEQALLVEQVANHSNNMLLDNSWTAQDVIEKIIMTAETSGNRYWIFARENEILFFKNSFELQQLKTKKLDKLLNSYKASHGYNVDALNTLLASKTNGNVLFSQAKSEKKILLSMAFFKVNDTNYSIGMFTTETYILSAGKIVKHNTYLIMVIVVVCLALFSAIILGTIIVSKKDEEIQINKKTLHAKNMKIEELTEVNIKADMIYNGKTKLYGQEVFYALLEKANRPELFPFSLLAIYLEHSENITYDDQVSELAPELHRILPKSTVATRVQENQLAIIFFKTEYGTVKDFEEKLLKIWSDTLNKYKTSLKTDVITQFIGQDAPIDVFELWNNQISRNPRGNELHGNVKREA